MNWEAIGAVGEIAGAAAVVISLVYLARQMNTSNRLARAEAFRVASTSLISLNAAFGTDPAFRQSIGPVIHEGATRSDFGMEEWIVLDTYLASVTDIYEQLHREVGEGILDDHVLADFTGVWVFELPYYRSSWHAIYKRVMSPSLIDPFEERFNLKIEQPS